MKNTKIPRSKFERKDFENAVDDAAGIRKNVSTPSSMVPKNENTVSISLYRGTLPVPLSRDAGVTDQKKYTDLNNARMA